MPARETTTAALGITQLAKRWGCSPERIRKLIDAGHLPDAFVIPSAGRYAECLKIPLAGVVAAEQRWKIAPLNDVATKPRRRPKKAAAVGLRHLVEFNPVEPDLECPAGESG